MTVNEPRRVCPPDTQQARTDGLRASAVKKGVYWCGPTQENGQLRLKSLELPNCLCVRVFEDKIGDRGLLRRWMLLSEGPWGHGSRCYLITYGPTSCGSPMVCSISGDLDSEKYLCSICESFH